MVKLGFQLLLSQNLVVNFFFLLDIYIKVSYGGFYKTKYLARSLALTFLILTV
jgi:hypothetical protein